MPKPSSNSKDTTQWLTVSYQPVSLFSLKRSDATSMAARSNLVPTPYAVKMALLRVLLEMQGQQYLDDFDTLIKPEFNWIRDLEVLIQPPEQLVVNRNGYKLRYWNQQADKDYRKVHDRMPPPIMPMQDGFVFREWVHLDGWLTFCCGATSRCNELQSLFSQINYFGKRGCFFQYLPDTVQVTDEPTIPTDAIAGFIVQPMDDLGAQTTFQRISPFSDEAAKLGKDRIITQGLLPLRMVATSARYDHYQRYEDD